MARTWQTLRVLLLALAVVAGCNPSGIKIESYKPDKPPAAVEQAKQLLQQYANGGPLGSEVTGYPQLIERVKQEDAQKGEILEKGLAEIQKAPGTRVEKAKALLKQL
ncbi:MAG: hypothetical protein ABFD16_16150 [Thermoguttaceae bacterium]|jgi:hypothetical protein